MTLRDEDLKKLRALVARADDPPDQECDDPPWAEPFRRMLDDLESGKWPVLTDKQRVWVNGIYDKVFDAPQYENLFSSGKVPRGTIGKTPTPTVLQNLPKKPPGRR